MIIFLVRKIIFGIFVLLGAALLFLFAYSQGKLGPTSAVAQEKEQAPQLSTQTIRIELIEDLKKRQEEVDRKTEELNRREDRIGTMAKDLDSKIMELKRVQLKLEELIKLRDDLEEKSITALSKTYAAMPPEEAAKRLKVMNRAIALRILSGMKSKKSAPIFSNLDPETATEMTEQLVKRKPGPAMR
ncbi:MAG: hypothetical protein IEMM0002_0091 [bacterium]|nr:MAG: hypothetical protein IEMM0002_0091 [bacterium]